MPEGIATLILGSVDETKTGDGDATGGAADGSGGEPGAAAVEAAPASS